MGYTALVPMAVELAIEVVKMARQAKEMDDQEFAEVKAKIDKEFANIPTWEEL